VTVSAQAVARSGWYQTRTDAQGGYRLLMTRDHYNIWAEAEDRIAVAVKALRAESGKAVSNANIRLISGGFVVGSDSVNSYQLVLDLYDNWDRAIEVAYIAQPGLIGDKIYFDLSGAEYGGWSLFGQWQIQSEGRLSVVVASLLGDFYIGGSKLVVSGDHRAVPEPGTLALLGGALIGFGMLRRRRLI